VAHRAHISPTWYTWLEQGRGGAPSAGVLDRIAQALMLTDVEREHLFLLGLGRPPEVRYRKDEGVTPRLQRVLDALEPCPALIRTAIWDVVAWNRAATVMLTDYGSLPPEQRNILRFIFLDPRVRAAQYDWEGVARFVVGAFRVDAARAGAAAEVEPLVDELCRLSPEFKAMWRDNDVRSHNEGVKHIRHPVVGPIAFEYSAFAVDGRPDLSMVVYNPETPADAQKISSLIGSARASNRHGE
jgi:transcriptional regulator with XRE-family HTH domain